MTIASALRVESFDFKERRFNDFGITWVVETIESSSAQIGMVCSFCIINQSMPNFKGSSGLLIKNINFWNF